MTDSDVEVLLGKVRTVVIARGPSAVTLDAGQVRPADLKGPTGNYRAPMVLRGRTLLVGFHESSLRNLLR